jgi:uncharacterized protein YvpB
MAFPQVILPIQKENTGTVRDATGKDMADRKNQGFHKLIKGE